MRKAFAATLVELAQRDARIVLLTGDLGYSVLEPFAEAFPDRFFNVGVAEQNMVALATGLAEAGFIPFVYSITPFAALRPYEAIRVGPLLNHQPVRIVGVGSGFEYGLNGNTHYGLEDVSVMRAQPGMRVIVPADVAQARAALRATWDYGGPIYYRLSKDDSLSVPGFDGRFEAGRAHTLGNGRDLAVITMGAITVRAVETAEKLSQQGIDATIVIVSDLAPAPVDDLIAVLRRVPAALTVEAHYVTGGLASLVSEVVAQHGLGCRVTACGVRNLPTGTVGSQEFLEDQHGLSVRTMLEQALVALGQTR